PHAVCCVGVTNATGAEDMQALLFRCPESGQEIDVGIETDPHSLSLIRFYSINAQCPVCGASQRLEGVGRTRGDESGFLGGRAGRGTARVTETLSRIAPPPRGPAPGLMPGA